MMSSADKLVSLQATKSFVFTLRDITNQSSSPNKSGKGTHRTVEQESGPGLGFRIRWAGPRTDRAGWAIEPLWA